MKIFYLAGPHCSGKTSILKRLFNDKIISFNGSEIGKEFYYERKNKGFKTEMANYNFEMKIANREIERDNKIMNFNTFSAVESWHPGNLAYVLSRNPKYYKKMLNFIFKHSPLINSDRMNGIIFNVSNSTIYNRTITFRDNPEWAVNFYSKISANISIVLKDLGLLEKALFVNADSSFDEVYNNVKKILLKGF